MNSRQAALFIFLLLFSVLSAASSNAAEKSKAKVEKNLLFRQQMERLKEKIEDLKDVEVIDTKIPLRDGQHLAAYIWLPKKGFKKLSTIYSHTPYNRLSSLADLLKRDDTEDRDKYAHVITDWRGFFGSKAAGAGIKKSQNGKDGYDVIEWIAKQPWSNGKVGMLGHSALGGVQFPIIVEKPPHLVCAVPSSGNLGHPFEHYYFGGVPKKHYLDSLTMLGFNKSGGIAIANLIKTKNALWEIAANAQDPEKIDLPMFFITSWFDTQPATKLDTFNKIRTSDKKNFDNMKLLIGPWQHCGFTESQQGELSFPEASKVYLSEIQAFFDQYLLGEDRGWSNRPPVRYFDMGSHRWKESQFYPPSVNHQSFYFGSGKTLCTDKGEYSPESNSLSFKFDPDNPSPTVGGCNLDTSSINLEYLKKNSLPAGPKDQRAVEARDDCVIFTTGILDEDISIVGAPVISLFCSTNQTDTDFAVRLTDVYPDGRSMLVSDGIHRLSFRDSLKNPKQAVPDEVYKFKIKLVPTAITFKKGHRIRVIVSSSNYPRFDVNPNDFRYGLSTFKKGPPKIAENRIYFSERYPSKLVLPVGK